MRNIITQLFNKEKKNKGIAITRLKKGFSLENYSKNDMLRTDKGIETIFEINDKTLKTLLKDWKNNINFIYLFKRDLINYEVIFLEPTILKKYIEGNEDYNKLNEEFNSR